MLNSIQLQEVEGAEGHINFDKMGADGTDDDDESSEYSSEEEDSDDEGTSGGGDMFGMGGNNFLRGI